MLVRKGGVIDFKKIHRIRMIKPILLVKNKIHNFPVTSGFDAARTIHRPCNRSTSHLLLISLNLLRAKIKIKSERAPPGHQPSAPPPNNARHFEREQTVPNSADCRQHLLLYLRTGRSEDSRTINDEEASSTHAQRSPISPKR